MSLKKQIVKTGTALVHFEGATDTLPNYTKDFGEVYIKVETINASKDRCVALVSFTSADTKYDKAFEFVPSLSDSAGNFIKQAYLHLKSLPDFAGAVDC
jgi:hypothetical protein